MLACFCCCCFLFVCFLFVCLFFFVFRKVHSLYQLLKISVCSYIGTGSFKISLFSLDNLRQMCTLLQNIHKVKFNLEFKVIAVLMLSHLFLAMKLIFKYCWKKWEINSFEILNEVGSMMSYHSGHWTQNPSAKLWSSVLVM